MEVLSTHMRIAFFSWESLHSITVGGVANHVTYLAEALARQGHTVHVFTRMAQADQVRYELIEGVHYHRCSFDLNHDFVEEMLNMCRSFVHHFFEEEKSHGPFDVVHAHDWLAAHAIIWIKKGGGHKAILTMHSSEYGRYGNNFYGGQSERIRHIEWYGMYVADKVIAVSQSLKNELMWIYNVPDWKTQVVYNGIEPGAFDGWANTSLVRRKIEVGRDDPMILFAGRMVYQKGPDLLLEAFPRLLHQDQNLKLIFLGDGDMRSSLEDRAFHLGVKSSIRFLGHLNGWRLKDFFKAANCVCIPSRNEPFGIVVLEAWSAGHPVVASNNGGPSEIVQHDFNGYKVAGDPDSLHDGLSNIFGDRAHARWMGKNGRKTAETEFSWDFIAQKTLQVYQQ